MLNDSTVTIKLGGEDRDLVCTIEAALVMSRAYGGMLELYEKVKALDLEAFTVVIRCGLMVDGKEAENLMETIFKSGLIDLQPKVAEYVLLMASGGVRQEETSGEGDAEPGKA